MFLVTKAVYGLRESPSLWGETRNAEPPKLEVDGYVVQMSPVHPSLWMLLPKEPPRQTTHIQDKKPISQVDVAGEWVDEHGNKRFLPQVLLVAVVLFGVYVDDVLSVGDKILVKKIKKAIGNKWKSSAPQFLSE
eukprot:492739-Amphidinium_carterae.1